MDTETNSPQPISRRDALRRGAVLGGALVWAAPAVQSVGMRGAFAQQNGTPETADFCPVGEGRITELTLRFTGQTCGNNTLADSGAANGCTEHVDRADWPESVYVEVYVGNCGGGNQGAPTNTVEDVTAMSTTIDTNMPPTGSIACTTMRVYDEPGGELLITASIHTSCSAELNLGEQYGPIEIYDGDWVAS